MKDKHHSKETKRKISLSLMGHPVSEETKRKCSEAVSGENHNNYGKYLSEETKRKIGLANSKKRGQIPWNKGRNGLSGIGEDNGNWKGGVTKINYDLRKQMEYRLWRKVIFEKYNFTCQKCKQHGGYLVAHHINNFSEFSELRVAIDNGIVLCKECHKKYHSMFGTKHNTKEQLDIFIG